MPATPPRHRGRDHEPIPDTADHSRDKEHPVWTSPSNSQGSRPQRRWRGS
ncbi:hypothetical protein KTR9_5146 (plasmid) [Gordonia sp. KTR9]|nr:hypothetical protein KTR9_5146 [Gordonia sp. KTR9]